MINRGFTLVEVVIATALLLGLVVAIYQGLVRVMNLIQLSSDKTIAAQLATEYLELARNLSYADVGLIAGVPAGLLTRVQTVSRNNHDYTVTYTIRNVDDPFDGLIGETPNDLTPADYKLVGVTVECDLCQNFTPVTVTATIAPLSLELTTGNGALFVKVFDANGDPVAGATVRIENNATTPAIDISETTNNDGIFQLIDTPPSDLSYQITASKDGYSTSRTYTAAELGGATPVLPLATILANTVTQISFAIDYLSDLAVETVSPTCEPIGSITLSGHGDKLIGTLPDTYKTDLSGSTNSSGVKTYGLEWDNYDLAITSTSYDLAGTLPLLPLALSPGANQTLKLILVPADPYSLQVTVKEAGSGLPLPDATVTLIKNGVTVETKSTNQGFFNQTDWSGGAGQDLWLDSSRYLADDSNVDVTTTPGEIKLKNNLGQYAASGYLTSSLFDTGATSTTFYRLSFSPQDQATSTGATPVRFQLATGNDPATTTWEFLGPDGTAATYYSTTDSDLAAILDNHRYLRYRVYLATDDPTISPNVADIAFTYSSACTPYGQVLFQGLTNGNYEVGVEKSGYQNATEPITISSADTTADVALSPQP